MKQVSLPQGTRDFTAETIYKRDFIFNTIRKVFELHDFEPLETPAMENLETLMGKYGEEGDQLIFKVLNNGLNNPAKHEKAREDFEKILAGKNSIGISERALKYDLTIPFARFVAMHHQQLHFPFKRYQMQPVWRADRPQKGRYREFYQCDADIVGSYSLLNEVSLALIYSSVFKKLHVNVEICLNHRKLLNALANICQVPDQVQTITNAIDKLDKIGIEKVKSILTENNIPTSALHTIEKYLNISGTNADKINSLKNMFAQDKEGLSGIADLEYILNRLPNETQIVIDPSLARGLNYYTGTIFEVKALDVKMGSIGGGGRYDDLTGLFGVPGIPGVGISFGVDRIFDVMEALGAFQNNLQSNKKILFFNTGEEETKTILPIIQRLHEKEIGGELFHEMSKFDKQFRYAEKKQIPFIAIIGSREIADKTCVIKHLASGKQETIAQVGIEKYVEGFR